MKEKVDLIIEWLRDELEYTNQKIKKGKGTWSEYGYIKDDDWAALMAEKNLLDDIFCALKKQGLTK